MVKLQIFGIITPIPGEMIPNLTCAYFFRWVGEKPRTSSFRVSNRSRIAMDFNPSYHWTLKKNNFKVNWKELWRADRDDCIPYNMIYLLGFLEANIFSIP